MRERAGQIALLATGVTVAYLATIRSGHVWGDDFVQYLRHALNLAAGEPYGSQGYVANPERSIGPAAYPPVFPAILLPVVGAFGVSFTPLKVLMCVLFGLALASIGLAFEPALRRRTWVLVLLLGAAPTFWDFKDTILSDVPFLIFCFLSLALIQRLVSSTSGRRQYALAIVTGVAIYLACGTRSQGLPLLPTLLIADAWKNERVRLAPLVAVGVTVVLVFLQNQALFTEGDRFQYLTVDPKIVWSNIAHYLGALSTYWNTGYLHGARYVVFVATIVLAGLGYARSVRRGIGPLEVFLPMFLLPLLFWVFQQGIRYLLPIVPLYLFYVIEGADVIAKRLSPPRARFFEGALLATALVVFVFRYSTLELQHIEGPLDPAPQAMFERVRKTTDPTAVIIFEKPRVMNLFTGRKAVIPTRVQDRSGDAPTLAFYRSIGADYVATNRAFEGDVAHLLPLLERNPDWAEEVWSEGGFQLWAIQDPDGLLGVDPESRVSDNTGNPLVGGSTR